MSVARFIADQRTMHRVPHAVCCRRWGSGSWFYKWHDRPPTAAAGAPGRARRRGHGRRSTRRSAPTGRRGSRGPGRAGWKVSVNTVADSMARQGLQGRSPKQRRSLTRQPTAPKFPDLLKRDFTAEAPIVNGAAT